jgi:hypothetical protein
MTMAVRRERRIDGIRIAASENTHKEAEIFWRELIYSAFKR